MVQGAINVVVVLGILLALLALNQAFATGWPRLQVETLTLPGMALASVALLLVTSLTWRHCLHVVGGGRISLHIAITHTAFMLIGKYVPGKVWGIALRAVTSARYALTPAMVMRGSFLEFALAVQSALIIGLPVYFLHSRPAVLALTIALLVGGSYFAYRYGLRLLAWLSRAVPKLGARLPGALEGSDPGARGYFPALALFCLQWAIICAIVLILLRVVHGAPSTATVAAVAAAYPLSVVAGFAAVFAPGGIGVREGAFVGLLIPFMPIKEAVDLALLLRAWNVTFDFLVGLAGYGLYLRGTRDGR